MKCSTSVERGETEAATPPLLRRRRNSLAAYSSGGVKPAGQNIGPGRQIFQSQNVLELFPKVREARLLSAPPPSHIRKPPLHRPEQRQFTCDASPQSREHADNAELYTAARTFTVLFCRNPVGLYVSLAWRNPSSPISCSRLRTMNCSGACRAKALFMA